MRKYRLHKSPAYHGRWVVQAWWPDARIWADIGDSCDTVGDAERKLRAEIEREVTS